MKIDILKKDIFPNLIFTFLSGRLTLFPLIFLLLFKIVFFGGICQKIGSKFWSRNLDELFSALWGIPVDEAKNWQGSG
jgi:hypothetical protein